MVRRVVTEFVDDLTGETVKEARTIHVVIDRAWYELDVSGESYRKIVEPLIEAGRKVPNPLSSNVSPIRPADAAPVKTKTDREQNTAMRQWWERNKGLDGLPSNVSQGGRIPNTVIEAFHKYGGQSIPRPAPEVPAALKSVPPVKLTDQEKERVTAARGKRSAPTKSAPAQRATKAATPAASRARTRSAKP